MDSIYIAFGCFAVIGLLFLISYFDENDQEKNL